MARTENVELTNMCMLSSVFGKYLLQDRIDPNWSGLVFPGGHVEEGESITESVIREVREETGITVKDPRLCGVKQFTNDKGKRYIVFLYSATQWEGTLRSSGEGDALWLTMDEIRERKTVPGFYDMLKVFKTPEISELIYRDKDDPDKPEYL